MLLRLRLSVAKTMHWGLPQTEAGDLGGAFTGCWMHTYELAVENCCKFVKELSK